MNVLTIDLEMNKPGQSIIQIGYTINNAKTGKMLKARSLFVNPNETIDPFITELTGISQQMVDTLGVPLMDAYTTMVKDIRDWQTSPFVLQWGLDHCELREQLKLDWCDYVFERRSIDVKGLYQAYAMSRPQGKTVAGLSKALAILGLEFEGRPHDALNDAVNTFRAFRELTTKMVKYDQILKTTKE